MRQKKKLMAGLAAVAAVATLAGTSAFADSRPQHGTRSSGGAISRDHGGTGGEPRRGNDSVSREPRRGNDSVSRGDTQRGNDTRRGNGRTYENDRDRSSGQRYGREETFSRGGNDRNRNRWYDNDSRYRNAQPYHTRGRISRTHRYDGGYRVWVAGAPYPFFIPDRYYRRDRFSVGLWINLGGFYNPLGYYDYYDGYDGYDGYSYDRYSDRRSYSRGELRGVVESVDSRRTSFVLRNEDTGSYVTVLPRGRRVYVRPGDYVEVDGTWTRSGYFTAYDIDWPDRDRYDDRDDDERYDR